MNFIVTYQNELIAALAILIVIFGYILIKNKNSKSSDAKSRTAEEALMAEVAQTINADEDTEEETHITKESTLVEEKNEDSSVVTLLDGKEEGNFGIIEKEDEEEIETEHKQYIKRDVPPHGKISKDDFKEFAGVRILLAEDNIINQKVILGLLSESGIEIVVANDGVEALEILENDNNFALVLMDAHMPRKDGFEATRDIRANPDYAHIAVIALSGDTAADDVRKMSEAGMCEHLEKPLKMDALYDILYAYRPQEDAPSNYRELNVDEGLEISGNDVTFYQEILNEFINSYANSHTIIEEFLNNNDLTGADRHLLDIIGVSANIGAEKLTKTAKDLKKSLHDNDNQRARALFKFKEDLEKLLKDIKNYLK